MRGQVVSPAEPAMIAVRPNGLLFVRFGGVATATATLVEETLELVGVAILVYALLDHLGRLDPVIVLQVGGRKAGS